MALESRNKTNKNFAMSGMTDIVFLLLIFFMISTTFLSQPAIKLELPEAEHADNIRQTPLVVYIDPAGRVYLNDEPIEIQLLTEALRRRLVDATEKSVVFNADSRVSHGRVVEILDVIKGAGVQKLSFGTRPPD